jgi:transcriptional regulator with XRE-family HTH domain
VTGRKDALADVIGRNCLRVRLEAGLTQDQFVRYAREVGLRWSASKVADFERGRREVTFGTVLAVSRALALAQAQAKERGVAVGRPVTLADLVQSDGNVVLTPDGPDPLAAVVADVCRGRHWPLNPVELMGEDEAGVYDVYQKVVAGAAAAAVVDGYLDPDVTATELQDIRQRFTLADNRLAQRLGVSRDKLAAMSFRLWDGRTFAEERDRRAGAGANQQRRARVSRDLRVELEQARADGG